MGVSKAVAVQGRVVWALMLREIHTLYGGDYLGYLWALINSMVQIGIFWVLRWLLGFHAPHGLSLPLFLITGFTVWNVFSNIVLKSVAATDGNRALLTFPQVTPLDLLLARAGVILATETAVMLILLALSLTLGYELDAPDLAGLLGVMACTVALGLGLGATLASLAGLLPVLKKIVPIFFRILFFISGIFFSATSLPLFVRDYVTLNPVLQLIEWLRVSMAPAYPPARVDLFYLVMWCLISLVAGLLLERYARGRLE